jgi:predicted metal-dependent phosphotriesterase family hydrolase
MGRDIGMLQELSSRSAMPIVAGDGFYTQAFLPRGISTMGGQVFQALMERAEGSVL